MPVEILMPELGESVHEGTIGRWLKKEGDFVQEDEPVVEIMTDKVNTELQAPASGILVKILAQEGEPVEVFKPMGLIQLEGEAPAGEAAPATPVAAAGPETVPDAPQPGAPPPVAPEAEDGGERRWFTPLVRKMAAEHGLSAAELALIAGTGDRRRVTKRDVEAFLSKRPPPEAAPAAGPEPKRVPPTIAGPDQEIVPLAGLRRMIAEAMARSGQVPTVTTVAEVDVTSMVRFRESNKDSFQRQFGVKLTFTPFFLKAVAEALIEFPLLNAALMPDDKILKNKGVHIGVAVSLGKSGDEGLIVPVIRSCHKKNLVELARDLEEIARKARDNRLQLSDVQGGTFTLTNPGSYGAVLGTPMINAPQAGILGTYAIRKVPVIVEDMIALRSVMNLVLTYDHRLVDGLLAGRFLQGVRRRLEAFEFFR
jgi:pyruvate/2-oxoglutarate dehydrogenase complex dihydrolipoamide acyltransferase (E2) component